MNKYDLSLFVKARLSALINIIKTFLQRLVLGVLAVGPIPNHVAFIMDGNRRYEKQKNFQCGRGIGYRAGSSALGSLLRGCYPLGIKVITVYLFSIDNFKRERNEVDSLMAVIREKVEEFLLTQQEFIHRNGIRMYFLGRLDLLDESVRLVAEKAMKATAHNTKKMLLLCIPYTSTDEITHGVQEACKSHYLGDLRDDCTVHFSDVEKRLYMSVAPDPDLVVRTSGETRLSNFLLWQTGSTLLFSTDALWPQMGAKDLFWAIISYQRSHSYLVKKRKQA